MKKFLLTIFTIFICTVTFAKTINWYVGDTIYQTTTCESGSSITPPTPPAKNGYTFVGWKEYIPIEYLESTGTQYIDTGVVLNSNSKIRVKFLVKEFTTSMGIFGTRGNYTSNNISVTYNPIERKVYVDFNNGSHSSYRITSDLSYNHTAVAESSKFARIIYSEDESIIIAQNTNICTQIYNSSKTAFLFAANSSDLPAAFVGIIYFAQIYDNDVLVRDFIPVLDRNGTPCMFDKVEGKFYYNAGTGQFIAGPVIGG